MIFEALIALMLGILAGMFTGLLPGIHINLVSVILISNLAYFDIFQPIIVAIFIVSMAIANTFIDFIPAIFLGAPEEDTFLSILPGHEMLIEGKAYEAIILTLYGSLTALALILFFTPIFIYVIPSIQKYLQISIPIILIFVSTYLILREKYIFTSLAVFLLAGFLGFISLNLPIEQPLLPLLTGLFGISALIISLKEKPSIPEQKISPLKQITLSKKEIIFSNLGAILSAPLCSFLPGIGSGHAAVISSEIIPQTKRSFLYLLGCINTIVMGLSFVALFIINKTRTGAAVAVKEILGEVSWLNLTFIMVAVIIAGIISFFIALNLSKLVSKYISKINYAKLSLTIIIVLVIVNLIFSNFLGIVVLVTSTALGVFTIKSKVRRINLMGCLLIPTIIFYIFLI